MPKRAERALMKRYGRSASRRIGTAVVLRAASILFRKHPRAAAHAIGGGIVQAGYASASEAKGALKALLTSSKT